LFVFIQLQSCEFLSVVRVKKTCIACPFNFCSIIFFLFKRNYISLFCYIDETDETVIIIEDY